MNGINRTDEADRKDLGLSYVFMATGLAVLAIAGVLLSTGFLR